MEVKWSDRPAKDNRLLRHVVAFANEHGLPVNPGEPAATVTTRTGHETKSVNGLEIQFVPTSLYAYVLGKNLLRKLKSGEESSLR
ncbi:hypothetical protein BH23VER1_BH23VER1_19570 [soil metagenome]